MDILIKAAQLILSLSILVVLHEFGHFAPAKWFKTRVEKFYLFFDPGFSLLKIKRGETEYGIGWLPLGGYVKIAGMVDESMDTEALKEDPKPWEFRSKPAWQRLIIMSGGVIVNVILGFVIYTLVLFAYGETKTPVSQIPNGFAFHESLQDHGLQNGDLIVAVGDSAIQYVEDIKAFVFFNKVDKITVERDGKLVEISGIGDYGQLLIDNGLQTPFDVRVPPIITAMEDTMGAKIAGLKEGDRITKIDGNETPFFSDVRNVLKDKGGMNPLVHYTRNGIEDSTTVAIDSLGRMGIIVNSFYPVVYDLKQDSITYTFAESIPAGFRAAKEKLQQYVLSLRFIVSPSGVKQVGSFIAIGNAFSPVWDWHRFWELTAWLSLVLAFMNILPIPALDGGHIMFLVYEMIAGKPAPQKFLERAQMVGIILLLSLMVFAFGNDIYRVFTGGM